MVASAMAPKVFIFLLVAAGLAVYFAVRCLVARDAFDFLIPGSDREDDFIRENVNENLPKIQSISWASIADRVTTYSSIALGIILVASIFLLAADPDDLSRSERTLFKVVLALAAISVLVYLTSGQLWQGLLGRGLELDAMLEMRKWASLTRAVAQFAMVAALVLSMLTVDTVLGGVVAAVAAVGVILFFEVRYRLERPNRSRRTTSKRRPTRRPTSSRSHH